MSHLLLIANAAATWFMAGLIWFVRVVHYPMFADVGPDAFAAYHRRHTSRTTWVVIGPMCVELLTAAGLVWTRRAAWTWAGLALVVLIWASTGLVQVPRHDRLGRGYDAAVVRSLRRTNWVRTVAWTIRAGLLAWAVNGWM